MRASNFAGNLLDNKLIYFLEYRDQLKNEFCKNNSYESLRIKYDVKLSKFTKKKEFCNDVVA